MANPRILVMLAIIFMATQANALIPYTRPSLFDMMLPTENPFRILEQTPVTISKGMETTLALARADWKEMASAHVITLDIPGMKKEDHQDQSGREQGSESERGEEE
ncbi:hypothetical protein Patl1_36663 [Pistacia atlantica]|nr:hypothetical protein Patl1_36663 [Pistacia atlantica]